MILLYMVLFFNRNKKALSLTLLCPHILPYMEYLLTSCKDCKDDELNSAVENWDQL